MVASALSPDTVKLPSKLLANLTVVEFGMLRLDSRDGECSDRIAHFAGKQ